MYKEHITDEEIKNFVSFERGEGSSQEDFVTLASKVNGHIRNCQECLDKVKSAQVKFDADKEIAEIDETIELSGGDYSSFDLARDIEDIPDNSVRVALMLHYIDRLVGIPAVTDNIARKATDKEKEQILEAFKKECIYIDPEIFPTPFKDTIMGKMTKGAIINWGEKDKDGNWFAPTEEQAEAMLIGKTEIGGMSFDYSSSEKATNDKTYASEIAAIDGLVELVANYEELSDEEKVELAEEMKNEIYTKSELSSELSSRITFAMEEKGIEASTIEILGTIHDNWVKTNGNKFDAPDRAKRLYQFTDLRLMSYDDDGAKADLLFLQPILEGAGIEIDVEGKLRDEFEKQQKEYMAEHGIENSKDLKDYLSNIEENYPTIKGVTTSKGKTLEQPVEIPNELKNEEILERMAEQVSSKIGIEYEKETPNFVSSKNIAEADKEQALTTTEVGVLKGFFKKLIDKLKGKGEK